MLIHILGNVGHVKIGVALIGELLELRVERFLDNIRTMAPRLTDGGGNVPEQS